MWLTREHTAHFVPTIHPWQCVNIHWFVVSVCFRIPRSLFLSSIYKFGSSAHPISRFIALLAARQRTLLSVVVCWDSCVQDAGWIAAMRVRSSFDALKKSWGLIKARDMACQYWHPTQWAWRTHNVPGSFCNIFLKCLDSSVRQMRMIGLKAVVTH